MCGEAAKAWFGRWSGSQGLEFRSRLSAYALVACEPPEAFLIQAFPATSDGPAKSILASIHNPSLFAAARTAHLALIEAHPSRFTAFN